MISLFRRAFVPETGAAIIAQSVPWFHAAKRVTLHKLGIASYRRWWSPRAYENGKEWLVRTLGKGATRRDGIEFESFSRVFRTIAVPAPVRPQWPQVAPT